MLATSEFGQEIQGEIDLYVTNDRLNKASFRQKVDPISYSTIKNQNSIKLFFRDIKYFDTQNPMIGSIIQEFDIVKKRI